MIISILSSIGFKFVHVTVELFVLVKYKAIKVFVLTVVTQFNFLVPTVHLAISWYVPAYISTFITENFGISSFEI